MSDVASTVEGRVLRIMPGWADKLNAVNTPTQQEITTRLDDATPDHIRAAVLTGAGCALCADGDLSGPETQDEATAANKVVAAITSLPKPVVGCVHGPATGFSCSLALVCDLVVTARSAFSQPAFAHVSLMLA